MPLRGNFIVKSCSFYDARQKYDKYLLYSGLVISGNEPGGDGPRVEVFVPSTGQQCSLPFLRDVSKGHTMEGTMVCGGGDGDTQTSCVNLTDDGIWERTATLLNRR